MRHLPNSQLRRLPDISAEDWSICEKEAPETDDQNRHPGWKIQLMAPWHPPGPSPKKNEGILRSFSKWSNHFGLWHLEKKRQQENSQWDQQLIIHLTGLSGGSPQSQSAGIISLPTGEWSNPSMVWEVAIWQPSGSTSCFKICPFLWEWPIYII